MKLYIKQKIFSIGERFAVKSEYGEDRYFVEGSVFNIPKRFRILDRNGNERLLLEKSIFTFMPTYDIIRNGSIAATITKKLTFLTSSYEIQGSPFSVEGDLFAHDYTIFRDGNACAHISKEWFTWGDSYMLDNYGNEDEEMLLAILIVIDFVLSQD